MVRLKLKERVVNSGLSLFRPSIDYPLHGGANFLVLPVNAADPTAWPAFSFL